MKTKTLHLILILLIGWISGCRNYYHYVSPLPATPEFTEAGEIEVQGGFGTKHSEIQVATSISKHLGFSYNGFFAPDQTEIHHASFFGFGKILKKHSVYWSAGTGYIQGQTNVNRYDINYFGSAPHFHHLKSNFQGATIQLGIYLPEMENEKWHFGIYTHLEFIHFDNLITYDEANVASYQSHYWKMTRPNTGIYLKPHLTFTYLPWNKGLLFRINTGYSIPAKRNLFAGKKSIPTPPGTEIEYRMPQASVYFLSVSIGLHLHTINFIRKIK